LFAPVDPTLEFLENLLVTQQFNLSTIPLFHSIALYDRFLSVFRNLWNVALQRFLFFRPNTTRYVAIIQYADAPV
jgi:hypothetical protein